LLGNAAKCIFVRFLRLRVLLLLGFGLPGRFGVLGTFASSVDRRRHQRNCRKRDYEYSHRRVYMLVAPSIHRICCRQIFDTQKFGEVSAAAIPTYAWASLAKKSMPQSSPISAPIATLPAVTLSVCVMGEVGTQIMELVLAAALIIAGAVITRLNFPRAP
jgi:hypothetical protein